MIHIYHVYYTLSCHLKHGDISDATDATEKLEPTPVHSRVQQAYPSFILTASFKLCSYHLP